MAYLKIRGNKYYAVWRNKGKKVVQCTEFTVGSEKTRREALARAQIMEAVATGRTTVEKAVQAVIAAAEAAGVVERKPSIAEFYEEHGRTHYIGKDGRNFRTALKQFLKFLGEDALKPMDKLSSEKCREFLARESLRVRANTVHAKRVLLNTAYNLAWKDGRISRNPWATATYQRKKGVERKRFTREEVQYILANLTYPWKQIVMLDIMTSGQRIGDVVNMKWQQINIEKRYIRLKTTKTGEEMELPLTEQGVSMLQELHAISGKTEYLFPIMHQRYMRGRGSLSGEFINMLAALGFETHKEEELEGNRHRVAIRCFHSFRHTVVSELQNNPQYTETYAEKLVGQSKQISKAYHSLLDEEKLQGISFLEDVLTGKKNPRPMDEP